MFHSFDTKENIQTSPSEAMGRLQIRSKKSFFSVAFLTKRTGFCFVSACFICWILLMVLVHYNFVLFQQVFTNQPVDKVNNVGKGKSIIANAVHHDAPPLHKNPVYQDFNYLQASSLHYKKGTYKSSVEILFRLPTKQPITSLLLIFHGCSRSAHDWFHTIERQRIIGAAIDLGYGCLAFQSTDIDSRCWSNEVDLLENRDVQMVWKGLQGFYAKHPELEKLPRFTFGSSSGGVFSSIFATNNRYPIAGQILFISIIFPQVLTTYVKKNQYPPTAWIYMPRDVEFASEHRINTSIEVFRQEKIPFNAYQIQPIPMTANLFHERIPTITSATSQYIFYRFQQNQWLDTENNLRYNPRRKETWKTFLFDPTGNFTLTSKMQKNLRKHRQVLSEFLNTIYGEHEISYEYSYEALLWHQDLRKTAIRSKSFSSN